MFIQIHMLQSVPPGNLNRDDTGQPKRCLFGGVTRGRISSQCLKRNIRHSSQFNDAFGEDLASRTKFLPRMVADALAASGSGMPEEESEEIMQALISKFRREDRGAGGGEDEGDADEQGGSSTSKSDSSGQTAQLVFFPPPFASRIAELTTEFKGSSPKAYEKFIRSKTKVDTKDQAAIKTATDQFLDSITLASQELTVDIALFGRMTTSDLVVNVEAASQMAHAISTHEVVIESDYFTAMDDEQKRFATSQTQEMGAAFLGSGDTETFFNSAVYYKYLNLDLDAVGKHLNISDPERLAHIAGALLNAAILTHPTGKQNGLANPTFPELTLVETSNTKRPVSYANAFLQPVEGGAGKNLMTESASAFNTYINDVAAAFAPSDVSRVLLSVGAASITPELEHRKVNTLDELIEAVEQACSSKRAVASS